MTAWFLFFVWLFLSLWAANVERRIAELQDEIARLRVAKPDGYRYGESYKHNDGLR